MNPNLYWRLFLALIGCCVIGYTGVTLYRIYHYVTLSERVPAKVFEWTVKERSSGDDYRVYGRYTFSFKEREAQGESVVESDKFLNPWSAKQAIPQYQARSWEVWVNPRNIHDSALQKYFPLKECISTVTLWGILLYFIWLGFYVNKDERNRT